MSLSFNDYPPLVFTHASEYFRKIAKVFQARPAMYLTFLRLVDQYNCKKINSGQVFFQANILFRGHEDLILGFNVLFPSGYYIGAVKPRKDATPRDGALPMTPPISPSYLDGVSAKDLSGLDSSSYRLRALHERKQASQARDSDSSAPSSPEIVAVEPSKLLSPLTVLDRSTSHFVTGYLRRIKAVHPHLYDEFLQLLREYRYGRLRGSEALSRTRELFGTSSKLARDFLRFLSQYSGKQSVIVHSAVATAPSVKSIKLSPIPKRSDRDDSAQRALSTKVLCEGVTSSQISNRLSLASILN